MFLITVTAVVILSPFERRAMDETFETLEIVQAFSEDINRYYEKVKYLPNNPKSQVFLNHDDVYREYHWKPHFGERFTYERTDALNYRVCATFSALPTETAKQSSGYPYDRFAIEKEGETCFDIKATESLSP